MSDQNGGSSPPKSPVAIELEQLRAATLSAAAKRERLPQPLFWSLFHSRINELKREKSQERAIRDAIAQVFDPPG